VLLGVLGYAYTLNDQPEKAHELLRLLKLPRFSEQDHYAIALVLLGLRRSREAVERLDLSFRSGSMWSLGFRSDPMLRGLWNCECFCDLIRRANFPAPVDGVDPIEGNYRKCAECQESAGSRASAVQTNVHTANALRPRQTEGIL